MYTQRKTENIVIAVLLLLIANYSFAAAKIENWQTPQNSRVYYVHTEGLPMVDVQVIFDAGSTRDGEKFGLANLTAAMLDTGAGAWNADDIAKRLESVGASFGADVSTDMMTFSLRSLTDKALLDNALTTMQTILTKPKFNEADFKREKSRLLALLKQQEELPANVASAAFYKTLYGTHPYGHLSAGTIKTATSLSTKDLKTFYQTYCVADNAIVVIVGDLSKEQAQQTAELLVKDLPKGKKPEPIADVTLPTQASQQHIEFPSTQTHVLVGLPVTYRKDPDYFNLYVGNHILGGSGLVSKLFDEVREKRGLAYSASSAFNVLAKPAPFVASLQTRNDQTQQALEVLNKTLTDFVNNGVTDAELKAAKQNIIGGFAMRFDTNKELSAYVAMIGFYQMPLDYLDTFTKKIEETSVASITDAFKRRLNLNALQTITVGKTAKTAEASAK